MSTDGASAALGPLPIERQGITLSRLVYGCMALGGEANGGPITARDLMAAEEAVEAALSIGITMFDHADVYRRGRAEEVFGRIMRARPGLRERITLQSKCGVRLDEGGVAVQYDLSKDWILRAVDESLRRLDTDHLDVLLLHRPDPLMRPEEVAEALTLIVRAGKVRSFGVSNMSAAQMRELQRHAAEPLVACQLEMSLGKLDWIERNLDVNSDGPGGAFPDGTLEYCHEHGIQLQAWAPLARGAYSGSTLSSLTEAQRRTAELVSTMAEAQGTSREAIVLGWLLKHPANIQAVIGTANPERIAACADSIRQADLMSRSGWYALLASARGATPP
jgi:predicted oxidoreductase